MIECTLHLHFMRSIFSFRRWAALIFPVLICSSVPSDAQVVNLAFEKHTIISNDCGPRRTNVVTTGAAELAVTGAGCNFSRGAFAGTLKLNFPASLPNVTNFSLATPMAFSIGVKGNWTIQNRFNEQNFGQTNYLTTRVRVFGRPCDLSTTNGPPVGAGSFGVETELNCTAPFLARKEVNGFDYIVEFETEAELVYRNAATTYEALRYHIISRYRAPGGPYLFTSTNLISQTANPRFPLPTYGVTIFNQGTADLQYNVGSSVAWLKMLQSGTIARGQSASVSGTVETNNLAAGVHEGAIQITGNSPNLPVNIPIQLYLLRDSLTLLSVDPPAGTVLSPGSLVRFTGTVRADLQTAGFGDIVFSLRDDADRTVEAAVVNLRSSTGIFVTNFAIPFTTTRSVVIPSNTSNLVLVPFLRETFDGGRLANAETVTYPVVPLDELTQANPNPPLGRSVAAGIVTNFSADVTFSLRSRSEADLALRVFDQNGVLQATSVDPANPSRFLRVRRTDGRQTLRLQTEDFTIAAETTNLLVKAVLIDPIALNVLKNSQTNIYQVSGPELLALEVTQVIQNLDNAIPLYSEKTTHIRAFIQHSAPARIGDAKLHVTRNGREIEGSPLSSRYSLSTPPDAFKVRDQLESSLLFKLPAADATGTLEFSLNATNVVYQKTRGPSTDLKVKVTFEPVKKLQVKFVDIAWEGMSSNNVMSISDTLDEVAKLYSQFPINASSFAYSTGQLTVNNGAQTNLNEMLLQLTTFRAHDRCAESCGRIYYGVVKNLNVGGLAYAGGVVGTGARLVDDPEGFARHNAGHEIAHSLGLHHAVHTDSGDKKMGHCEESAPADAPDYPYSAEIDGHQVDALGPMDSGVAALVYGMDNLLQKVNSPYKIFELMSYCGNKVNRYEWVSQYSYGRIATALQERFGSVSARAAALNLAAAAEPPADFLLVRGLIDPVTGGVQWRPFSQLVRASSPEMPPAGAWELRLLNGQGALLHSVTFQPEWPVTEPLSPVARGAFVIPVPANPNYRRAEVIQNNTPVGAIQASAGPPTVRLLSPNGNENISSPTVTISWEASDPDNDPLLFTVQFSPDLGNTWETLAVDWSGRSYTLARSYLSASTMALIRVIASDGFLSAWDVSDNPFRVANQEPAGIIVSPGNGQAFAGTQTIDFESVAFDKEEGPLQGRQIQWVSDKNGPLGFGNELHRVASSLAQGQHTITLLVTDAQGAEHRSTVNITIFGAAPNNFADLAVTTEISPFEFTPGSLLTNRVRLFNHGPATVSRAEVQAILPSDFNVATFSATGGTVTRDGSIIRGTFSSLRPAAEATLLIVGSSTSEELLDFSVFITGAFIDPNPANNSASATVGAHIEPGVSIGIRRSGAEIILYWRGSAAVFDLEFTDSLVGGVWQRVPAMVTSRGDEHSVTVTSSTAARFYRLRRR